MSVLLFWSTVIILFRPDFRDSKILLYRLLQDRQPLLQGNFTIAEGMAV